MNRPWTITPKSDDIICTSVAKSISDSHHQSFSLGDGGYSSWPGVLSIGAKIFLTAVAAFTLPLLVLQIFLVPIKIIMGLKAFTLANSILLGSLVAKYFNSVNQNSNNNSDDDDDTENTRTDKIAANILIDPKDYNIENDDVKRILKFVKVKDEAW